jgi:hypothetical protein
MGGDALRLRALSRVAPGPQGHARVALSPVMKREPKLLRFGRVPHREQFTDQHLSFFSRVHRTQGAVAGNVKSREFFDNTIGSGVLDFHSVAEYHCQVYLHCLL